MAEPKSQYTGLWGWIDARMPTLMSEFKKHASEYYAPKNFNFWYIFGGIAIVVLVLQIFTGIFLTMHYKPDANLAFASVAGLSATCTRPARRSSSSSSTCTCFVRCCTAAIAVRAN